MATPNRKTVTSNDLPNRWGISHRRHRNLGIKAGCKPRIATLRIKEPAKAAGTKLAGEVTLPV
jgi:hypothetical protein